MNVRGVLVLAVPALFAGGGALSAQATPTVGDRVRVATADQRFEGRLLSWSGDSLTVARGDNVDRLARASLVSLDRQVGRKSRFLRGVGIGALAGGLSGAAFGALAGEDCNGDAWLCFNHGVMALAGGIAGATMGVVVGGVIGALSHGAIWQPVPVGSGQASIRFAPVVSAAGVGVGVRLSFR